MKIRFLLDENRSPLLADAMRRRDPTIDVLRVGDAGAPPLHTLDPELLLYCEREQRLLVTNNRHSMPKHIADHLAAGHHHWGVFRLSREMSLGQLSEQLHLLWPPARRRNGSTNSSGFPGRNGSDMMKLEDYFDFSEAPDYIRIQGHRIGIEHVVRLYNDHHSPEMIAQEFPGLSLEKIYATLAYYLRNKADVDAYMAEQIRSSEERWRQAQANPSPMMLKMRAIKEQWEREGRWP